MASEKKYVRPSSMPSTSLSETLRSTVLTVSLTASAAVLRFTIDVEKARGANAEVAREREFMAVRVRKDIVTISISEVEGLEVFVYCCG
jgi:hypothetical protein